MAPSGEKEIGGIKFKNFSSHSNNYPCGYLTAAAAIGMTRDDIDSFIKRLDKVLSSLQKESQLTVNLDANST